jgi:hypothetical protein
VDADAWVLLTAKNIVCNVVRGIGTQVVCCRWGFDYIQQRIVMSR